MIYIQKKQTKYTDILYKNIWSAHTHNHLGFSEFFLSFELNLI